MERKEFLKKAAVGSSMLLSTSLLFNACSDDDDDLGNGITVDLGSQNYSALQEVGGFAYTGDIIIIRSGENTYIALSKICTHESCTVEYSHANNQLPCPCHGSVYSTSGAVLNGPAERSLKVYSVRKEGDILTIT